MILSEPVYATMVKQNMIAPVINSKAECKTARAQLRRWLSNRLNMLTILCMLMLPIAYKKCKRNARHLKLKAPLISMMTIVNFAVTIRQALYLHHWGIMETWDRSTIVGSNYQNAVPQYRSRSPAYSTRMDDALRTELKRIRIITTQK